MAINGLSSNVAVTHSGGTCGVTSDRGLAEGAAGGRSSEHRPGALPGARQDRELAISHHRIAGRDASRCSGPIAPLGGDSRHRRGQWMGRPDRPAAESDAAPAVIRVSPPRLARTRTLEARAVVHRRRAHVRLVRGPLALAGHFRFHSRASFCASAIWAGVIRSATPSRARTALSWPSPGW